MLSGESNCLSIFSLFLLSLIFLFLPPPLPFLFFLLCVYSGSAVISVERSPPLASSERSLGQGQGQLSYMYVLFILRGAGVEL